MRVFKSLVIIVHEYAYYYNKKDLRIIMIIIIVSQ